MEVLSQDNWTTEVTNELRKFEKTLIIALKVNNTVFRSSSKNKLQIKNK